MCGDITIGYIDTVHMYRQVGRVKHHHFSGSAIVADSLVPGFIAISEGLSIIHESNCLFAEWFVLVMQSSPQDPLTRFLPKTAHRASSQGGSNDSH